MADRPLHYAGIIFYRMHKASIGFSLLAISEFAIADYVLHEHHNLGHRSIITIFGIVAAVTGWIFTSWISSVNTKKQHTMNILLQSRLSAAYQSKLKDAIRQYPNTPVQINVEEGNWELKEHFRGIEGIKYLLNFFEFVAIGVMNGDFDERILRKSLSDILNNLVVKSDKYIAHLRSETPSTFEYLIWLNDRWKKPPIFVCEGSLRSSN